MTLNKTQLKNLLKRFDPVEPVDVDKIIAEIIRVKLNELSKNLHRELSQEVRSIKVKDGDSGEQGERGEVGGRGKDGRDGVDGKSGKDGRDGISKDGVDGKDGLRGLLGARGMDGSPDEPEIIREKLETLKGEDRLDASAIKNLPVERILGRSVGAGGSEIKSTDLSSQLDGSTKDFTVPANKRFNSLMGTQFPIVFRPDVDFTGSGTTTLTLTSEVSAPEKGQTLILTYAEP